MPKSPKIILDSSVIFSALFSPTGASAEILKLAEKGKIVILLPKYIEKELEDVLERKFPFALSGFHELITDKVLRLEKDPSKTFVGKVKDIISDPEDAPILAAAIQEKVDCLITLDRKDFIDDPQVTKKSKLKILTPGAFIKLFRID